MALGVGGVGAAWLVVRAGTTGLGGFLAEIDVLAAVTPLGFAGLWALGPRRVISDGTTLRVTRRGRTVFERPLDQFVAITGFGPWTWLQFADGARVWWTPFGVDWGPATAALVAWRPPPVSADGPLALHADRIRFPDEACVGCGAVPTGRGEICARRGISLVLWGFFVTRSIAVPACPRCLARRRRHALAWSLGPILGLVAAVFLPLFTPVKGAPIAWLAAVCLGLLAYGSNRDEERADDAAYGIRARLGADGSTVSLRFRDPVLGDRVAAASTRDPTPGGSAQVSL